MQVLNVNEIDQISGAGLFDGFNAMLQKASVNLAKSVQGTVFNMSSQMFPTILKMAPQTTLGKALQAAFVTFALIGNPKVLSK